MVMRLGGSEFVLVQTGIDAPADVAECARRIEQVLGEADAALRARKLERKRSRLAIPSIVLASGVSAALVH